MKRIKSLPEPLQKQILLRFGMAAALFILGIASAIMLRDKSVLLIFAVAIFCAAQGVRIALRPYIIIKGSISAVQATSIRRRSKAILIKAIIDAQEVALRVTLNQRLQKFSVGEVITLYIDATARIYEWDNEFRLQSYICIDKAQKS